MSDRIPLRTWATPLVIGAFLLMAVTGVLMFFGYDRGLTAVVHEWFSWAFLAGAAGHLAANVRSLKTHLKSSWGQVSVSVFGAILAASCFAWGRVTGPQLKRPAENALADAPLAALADLTRTTPDSLVRKLQDHGITASRGQTLRDLSVEYHASENRLLAIVFLP
jgi:hypothetical protein